MPFDVPQDPRGEDEYLGGILVIFNEAVVKFDTQLLLENNAIRHCQQAFFLSSSENIQDKLSSMSEKEKKKYLYVKIQSEELAGVINEMNGNQISLDDIKYRFAFVTIAHGVDKAQVASDIEKNISRVKRTMVIS